VGLRYIGNLGTVGFDYLNARAGEFGEDSTTKKKKKFFKSVSVGFPNLLESFLTMSYPFLYYTITNSGY
jgi:hypothetical protein